MPSIVIVGAGISGLALAYRLEQLLPQVEITVLEQRDRPGGTVWTERQDGFQLEIGPNGFLDTKPSTLALCRDLGLGDQLISASEAASQNRFLFLGDRLRALPGGFGAFLRTDLLSWRGKISFLLERFRRRRGDSADESIDAFARRRAGREVAEVFADALVTGIHAGDSRLLSVRAAFPRLAALEEEHGSVLKGLARSANQRRREAAARGEPYQRPGKMWSLRDGMGRLIETLAARLVKPPLFGVDVRQVMRAQRDAASPAWNVQALGRDSWSADTVILACPAHQQAAVLHELDPELADRIGSIAYNRIAVVGLGYRRNDVPTSIDGFGYIAPQRLRRDVLGVQWCSSIYPGRAPADALLLRAMCGGWHRADVVGWDDARLVEAVRADLRLAMNIDAPPIFQQIIRWDRAIPQYHLGHLERVAWIESRLGKHPGLFVAGNAYHGVALNDCTEQADVIAERVRRYLQHRA